MAARSEKTKEQLHAIIMAEFAKHPDAKGFGVAINSDPQPLNSHLPNWSASFIINRKTAPPTLRQIITRLQTEYTLV
jgi:hypothetical protein